MEKNIANIISVVTVNENMSENKDVSVDDTVQTPPKAEEIAFRYSEQQCTSVIDLLLLPRLCEAAAKRRVQYRKHYVFH
ncbi:hypothetical protein TNCV_2514731 [Trichonephila clavipes]|nr:hypothetical protein TNCV_2514731 [Trichonephila clavipes]